MSAPYCDQGHGLTEKDEQLDGGGNFTGVLLWTCPVCCKDFDRYQPDNASGKCPACEETPQHEETLCMPFYECSCPCTVSNLEAK